MCIPFLLGFGACAIGTGWYARSLRFGTQLTSGAASTSSPKRRSSTTSSITSEASFGPSCVVTQHRRAWGLTMTSRRTRCRMPSDVTRSSPASDTTLSRADDTASTGEYGRCTCLARAEGYRQTALQGVPSERSELDEVGPHQGIRQVCRPPVAAQRDGDVRTTRAVLDQPP